MSFQLRPFSPAPSLFAGATLALALAPAAAAQHLLVGGPDTLIRRAIPVTEAFDVVGACGGIVESMAATGDTTYIGDRTGVIYVHTPTTGVGYAFNAGNDARALAVAGPLLFVGGSNGSIERYDAPTGSLETTWRAPGPVRALETIGSSLYVALESGAIFHTSAHGVGDFIPFADCGCSSQSMTSDGTAVLIGGTDGMVRRIEFHSPTMTSSFAAGTDCAAMGIHLGQLLVGSSDGTVTRLDAIDGTIHDVYHVGSSVSALALTDGNPPAWTYCYGIQCPCGNDDPVGGCANSTGRGARLDAAGSSSVALDDLSLIMTRAPVFAPALLIMGSDITFSTLGDGHLCTGGNGGARRFMPTASNEFGTLVVQNLGAFASNHFNPASQLVVGSSWHFQVWYRDSLSPCGAGFNTTNSAEVTFTP